MRDCPGLSGAVLFVELQTDQFLCNHPRDSPKIPKITSDNDRPKFKSDSCDSKVIISDIHSQAFQTLILVDCRYRERIYFPGAQFHEDGAESMVSNCQMIDVFCFTH